MFSATAIADSFACRHLTALNRARADGEIKKPFFADPCLELLKKLGLAHEQEYLRYLAEDRGLEISKIPDVHTVEGSSSPNITPGGTRTKVTDKE